MRRGRYVLLLVLILLFLGIAAGVSILFMELGPAPPSVPAAAYLDIKLEGALPEYAESGATSLFGLLGRPVDLHDVWSSLRLAARDARIRGVLVRLGPLLCDWAKAAEIRGALLAFRASGKPAIAYLGEGFELDKEYYLATGCDKIVLPPIGLLPVTGVGGYTPFFKRALDKLGVRAEFEQVEEFKTAADVFTRTGFTPAHREMTDSLVGDVFDRYVRDVAAARKKTEAEVRALIDRGFFGADEALKAGLVDRVLYEDEAAALLGAGTTRVPVAAYARVASESQGPAGARKIAVIYGQGMIHGGESLADSMGSDTMARLFRAARADKSIAAVVFRIDSPGGSAVASDEIWHEISLCRKEKPVVVSMSDLAGSGGYWIALAASRIVAQPQTLTGSIGVLAGKFDLSGLYGKLGIDGEKAIRGARADFATTFRPWTTEERALLKSQILSIYEKFVARTAEGRKLAPEAVDKAGKGRVWTGNQALGLGLVDELGGLTEAIDAAKGLAGIPRGEPVRLVVRPRRATFFEFLFGRRPSAEEAALPASLRRAAAWLTRLGRSTVWATMPLLPGI